MVMQRTREPGAGYPHRDGVGPWAREAACRTPGAPDMHPLDAAGRAKAVAWCGKCPVREECLEHALVNRERHGVWGGATEEDRKGLLRRRGQLQEVG